MIRADGSAGWVFSRAIPFLDENDGIVEWFGAASDVTVRKRAETNLAFLSEASQELGRLTSIADSDGQRSAPGSAPISPAPLIVFGEVDEAQEGGDRRAMPGTGPTCRASRGVYRIRDFHDRRVPAGLPRRARPSWSATPPPTRAPTPRPWRRSASFRWSACRCCAKGAGVSC